MWPFCDANSPWWLLIPLLLGLLTGWWAWANRRAGSDSDEASPGLGSTAGGAMGAAEAGIAGAADTLSSDVADAAKSSVSGAEDGASGAIGGIAAGMAGAAGAVASGVVGAVDAAKTVVSGAEESASAGVADTVDSIKLGISGAVDAASDGAASVADAVSGGASEALDKAGDLADNDAVAAADATPANAKRAAKPAATDLDGNGAGTTAMSLVGNGVSGAAAAGAIGIAAAVGDPDDLLKIKGIGPKLNALLNRLGVTRFDQIAAWSDADVAKVDAHMEDFQGRIGREEWIPQAKLLATGQNAEWQRLYGTASDEAGANALTAIGIPAATGDPDDLLQIKGVGPKLNALLISLGVTRFDQIAAWSDADVAKVDAHMEDFQGRIGREEWIPQAKLLATGQNAEWQRLYGTAADAAGAAGAVALTAIGIPAAVGDPDNLLQIKGVGPKLNALLISLGVTRFDQIAAWGAAEIDKVDDHLGNFKSRIGRDGWVEQAGLLATGKIAEFEAKFGKLDSENK